MYPAWFCEKKRKRADNVVNEKFIDVALPDLTPIRDTHSNRFFEKDGKETTKF
jgi:hypothetical protein